MKIMHYESATPTFISNDQAKGISARVVIGKQDGADHFCMRVFEIASGGYTPRHTHAWEHEIFIHAGVGEVFGQGQWNSLRAGQVIFVPPHEEHQIRNTGVEPLIFACLIPAGVPEL